MSFSTEKDFQETLMVLIDALNDKDSLVNNAGIKSLTKIANMNSDVVLLSFCSYYRGKQKISDSHLGNIVRVLEQSCVSAVKNLSTNTVSDLIATVLTMMTRSGEYVPDVQMGASAVLVAIGHTYYDKILRNLLDEMKPDAVPHYTIPHTLGTLAAVNTQGTVSHLKEILSKMLPLLAMVKSEVLKQAFSYAFGHFAVAVSEQIGDTIENDNMMSIRDNFVFEFSVIFDILFNQWLSAGEPKVTESVLEALGPLTRLISDKKFDDIINKLISSLLSLYKRSGLNIYYVSQCISYILTPSPLNTKLNFSESMLNSMNSSLFQCVLLEPDYDRPQSVKNHFEVLRCFDHLAGLVPESTIEYLLHQCKSHNEKERVKSVTVLTHLTTSSHIFIEQYANKFISFLKIMTSSEQNVKMKKVIVKAIVALVYRNCLINIEDFFMVEFIVKHCSYDNQSANQQDCRELRETCKNSLFLLSNTVTCVKHHLKTMFLRTFLSDMYSESCSTIVNCLTYLYQPHADANKDYVVNDPLPLDISSEEVFVHCMIFLIDSENVDRNKNILKFLDVYSIEIHKNLTTSWQVDIQRLVKYVDKNESNQQWHQMLVDFIISAIDNVNSSKWVENLAEFFCSLITANKTSPIVRGVTYQYLAVLTCHMSNIATVQKTLNIIMCAIRFTPLEGSEYLCKAIGIASRQHVSFIMEELGHLFEEIETRRRSKFMNFISNKHSKLEAEALVMKYTLILCYGEVALESLDTSILTILNENVTTVISEILKCLPGMDLSRACLTTLYRIAMALEPASHHSIIMRNRWALLNVVLDQIFNPNLENRNVELFPLIVKAAKTLTRLQKGILPEERNTILRILITSVFNELASLRKKYESVDNEHINNEFAKTLNDTITLIHELIGEFVIQSTCLSTIDDLVCLIGEWLYHENDEIRNATIVMLNVVFATYIKNVKINFETPSKFSQIGYLLGLILPSSTDSNFAVRLAAVDNIKLIIQIQNLYEGQSTSPQDACVKRLTSFHNIMLTNDVHMISEYSSSLAEIVCDKIPYHQLLHFIECILSRFECEGLTAMGISSVLSTTFQRKGQDLYQNVQRIVELLLRHMDNVAAGTGKNLLNTLSALAHHHSNAVAAVLLAQSIPFKQSVINCWLHIARDKTLSEAVVDNFLRMMTSIQLFEEPYQPTEPNIAALQPLTVVSALGYMFQEDSMNDLCTARFPDIFSMLYTTLGCYTGSAPPAYTIPTSTQNERFGFVPNREAMKLSPAKITLDSFCSFLTVANCQKVKEACTIYMHTDEGEHLTIFLDIVPILVGMLCRETSQHLARIVTSLNFHSRSPLPPQRIAVLAFFGELLNYRCNDNPVLLETIMTTLNSGWKDSSNDVKVVSIKGMANVCQLKLEYQYQYISPVLLAMSQGIDDQQKSSTCSNVPLAAVEGLCRLLTNIKEYESESHRELISIAQKIKPFMNTDNAVLREASIRLYGILAEKVKVPSLTEQAVAALPCFLLHLCDDNLSVIKASKFTLKKVFRLFNASKSNTMVQTHLLDEGKLYYDEFLSDLLKNLAEEVPTYICPLIENSISYLNSNQVDIRAHGALLLGSLYGEITRLSEKAEPVLLEIDRDIKQQSTMRLIQLMKDSNPRVRQYCATALANICLISLTQQ